MATRPVFLPSLSKTPGVVTELIEFDWSAGMHISRKQLNIDSLHYGLREKRGADLHPLEISSKSKTPLGIALSAFILSGRSTSSREIVCVESVYQASKVFKENEKEIGPFPHLYGLNPKEVRQQIKPLEEQGLKLIRFQLGTELWPLKPQLAFYTWLYCVILDRNQNLVDAIHRSEYNCFTDIEFNPKRSLNCQAFAVAYYLSLEYCGLKVKALGGKENFLESFSSNDLLL